MYFIALLPFPVLYLFAGIIRFFVADVFKYRKKVIDKNLSFAFPEKSVEERKIIKRKFYKYYTEVLVEAFKLLLINKKQLFKRIEIIENADWKTLKNEPRGAMILTGHLGNFEWAGQRLGFELNYRILAAYKPFSDRVFEKIYQKLRGRFNTDFIPMKRIVKDILAESKNGLYAIFLNDINPTKSETPLWVNFLNRDAKFFITSEKIAKKFDLPVYFANMIRVKQGYYKISVKKLVENPNDFEDYKITEIYATELEKVIHENPPGWLWSHRRWKHKKE